MKSTKWMFACALGVLMLTGNFALAQGHGNGKGHGKHGDEDDQVSTITGITTAKPCAGGMWR